MAEGFKDANIQEISNLLGDYFDGLYEGDIQKFSNVFHPESHLYFSDGGLVTDWPRSEYFEMISNRPSPASQGLMRHDKIISINMSGPATAFAIVQCAIAPRYFTDYLTLLKTNEGWQIISKTFHTDTH